MIIDVTGRPIDALGAGAPAHLPASEYPQDSGQKTKCDSPALAFTWRGRRISEEQLSNNAHRFVDIGDGGDVLVGEMFGDTTVIHDGSGGILAFAKSLDEARKMIADHRLGVLRLEQEAEERAEAERERQVLRAERIADARERPRRRHGWRN
jgi:hypothetical protein